MVSTAIQHILTLVEFQFDTQGLIIAIVAGLFTSLPLFCTPVIIAFCFCGALYYKNKKRNACPGGPVVANPGVQTTAYPVQAHAGQLNTLQPPLYSPTAPTHPTQPALQYPPHVQLSSPQQVQPPTQYQY